MRVIECTKSFNRNGFDFQAGHSYVLPEDVESQFRSVAGDCLGMSHPIESIYKKYNGEDFWAVFRQSGLFFWARPICLSGNLMRCRSLFSCADKPVSEGKARQLAIKSR